jgi:hypothetical protein
MAAIVPEAAAGMNAGIRRRRIGLRRCAGLYLAAVAD